MSRPSKDHYFMSLALLAAQRASCPRRKVGCILVDQHNYVVSTGYNGPATGLPNCTDKPCGGQNFASGTGLNSCIAIHAEMNALSQASERLKDVTAMYLTAGPCCQYCTDTLVSKIKQAEMPNFKTLYFFDHYPSSTAEIFEALGIELVCLGNNLDESGLLFKTAEMLGLREARGSNNRTLCVGGALHGCMVTINGAYMHADPSECTPEELRRIYQLDGAKPCSMDVTPIHEYYRCVYRFGPRATQSVQVMRFSKLTDCEFAVLIGRLKMFNPVEFMS